MTDGVAKAIFEKCVELGIEDVASNESWETCSELTRGMYREIAAAAAQKAIFYDSGKFEGQTQAEWEASRGRDSSICNADYWNREYRKQGAA